MKLTRLQIHRLPGIHPGFTVEPIGTGINVITGPNASGKSSLMRALRACLYAEELPDSQLSVEAQFETRQGQTLTATRLGRELQWRSAGNNAEAPPLPEHHLLPCYTLRVEDLLASDNVTDKHIAEQLRRELAGGYDIPAITQQAPFYITNTRARAARLALAEAERALRECQGRQEALLRDEQQLTVLKQQRDEAAQAQPRQTGCDNALSLLIAQRELKALEAQLQDYPEDMARLSGEEPEQLLRLRKQQQALQDKLQHLEQAAAQAKDQHSSSGLPDSVLSQADVQAQRPTLSRLRDLEKNIQQLHKEKHQAAAELEGCVAALGGEPGQMPRVDPTNLQQVESELEAKRGIDAELRELGAALERLGASEDSADQLDLLRQARHELLQWLASPASAVAPGRRRVALLLLAAMAVVGAGLAYWVHPLLTPALLLPTAFGVFLGWQQGQTTDTGRATAQQRYPADVVPAPASWQVKAVQSRLQSLDRELLAAEEQAQLRRQVAELQQQLQYRQRQQEDIANSLGELARHVGFDPRRLDASFARWLHLISELDRARKQQQKLTAELEQQEEEAEKRRADLQDFLLRHGEAAAQNSADVLEQRLDHLLERIRQKQAASDELQRIAQQQAQVKEELATKGLEIATVFQRAAIVDQDDAMLQQRIERLADWRALREQLHEQRSIERERRSHLTDFPELQALVDAADESELLRQQDLYRRLAEQWPSLIEEIKRIEMAIDQAGSERRLESARAAVQQCRDELEDALEETLFAESGRFLLEQVSQEHVRSSQPAALRQAVDWFARFTRHQFQLQSPDATGSDFIVLDNSSGEHRNLSQLSSGTRMQLLLAVRLAFALQAESGREPLPLILDETLTTSDPERFRAVAQSLHTLVQEDKRQIFYLSSQPGDIAYWREVDPDIYILDLPAIRQQAGAIEDADQFTVPAREVVPEPGQDSAAQYAVRIAVPTFSLWDAVENTPLFYLLRDDLTLLHRLLQAGIKRLGQLQSLLGSDHATLLLNPEEAKLLSRRSEATRRWQHARRQGQGRPIDRSVLEAAPAVSDVHLERVDEQRQAVGGDAAALIQCLEEGKVSRFRKEKMEEFREWLEEKGHIDPASPLQTEEIDQKLLSALITSADGSNAALQEAQALRDSLENGLQG